MPRIKKPSELSKNTDSYEEKNSKKVYQYKQNEKFQYINNRKPMLLSIIKSDDTIGDVYENETILHCEIGMGHTVAHALRRVLLSNFLGMAPVAIRVKAVNKNKTTYAQHALSVLPGISESIMDLILNIRQINVQEIKEKSTNNTEKSNSMFLEEEDSSDEYKISIIGSNAGELTASNALSVVSDTLDIMNKDVHIVTLDTDTFLYIDICYGKGYGAARSHEHKFKPSLPEGYIPIDSWFSPVKTYKYIVEEQTSQVNHYDKVTINISSSGEDPNKLLQQASFILTQQFKVIAKETSVDMESSNDNQINSFLFETEIKNMAFQISITWIRRRLLIRCI